jgi:hypothetical protein
MYGHTYLVGAAGMAARKSPTAKKIENMDKGFLLEYFPVREFIIGR